MRELEFPNCGFDWYVLVSALRLTMHSLLSMRSTFTVGEMGHCRFDTAE
jgi:hypothetical protein